MEIFHKKEGGNKNTMVPAMLIKKAGNIVFLTPDRFLTINPVRASPANCDRIVNEVMD